MRKVVNTTPGSADAHQLTAQPARANDTNEARYERYQRAVDAATVHTLTPDGFQLYLIKKTSEDMQRMYFDNLEAAIADQEEGASGSRRFERFY